MSARGEASAGGGEGFREPARYARTAAGYVYRDIRGQAFGRLTAVEPLDKRDRRGGVVWLCRCACGATAEVSADRLLYSGIRSCGCQKRRHDRELSSLRPHVDGTSIDNITSKAVRSDNTTGVRGVYLLGGRYAAKMVFQGRQYQLGVYETLEEAAAARRDAEAEVFAKAARHYEAWAERAAAEPLWAERNPIRFEVAKEGGSLHLVCRPELGAAYETDETDERQER